MPHRESTDGVVDPATMSATASCATTSFSIPHSFMGWQTGDLRS
jgi:hypothetical protein